MKKDKNMLLMESVVFLAVEIYKDLYDADIEGVSDDANTCAAEVIGLAKQFEKELDWQENDERDYFKELDKYVMKVRQRLFPNPFDTLTKKYEAYLKDFNSEPAYAEADIKWKDSGEICEGYIFKLSSDIENMTDSKIFYNCEDPKDFIRLVKEGGDDFVIIDPDDIRFFQHL